MRTNRTLLTATALAMVLASAGLAGAQSSNEGNRGPGASSAEHGTSAPRAQSQGAPQGSMGNRAQQGQQEKFQQEKSPSNRMGQSEPNRAEPNRGAKSDSMKPSAQTEKNQRPSAHTEQTEKNQRPSAQTEKNQPNSGAAQNERGRNDNRGTAENRNKEKRGTVGSEPADQNRGAAENRGRADENRGAAENRQAPRGSNVSLSTEQRTKVRETIIREKNAPRLSRSDINISLNVGERIPRDRIRIRPLPLPSSIVEIEPQWRGYLYFLVGDEIVVVEPDTYEVVAVIPA